MQRTNRPDETDASALSAGHAQIAGDFINEAQLELWVEANWYSLYKTRTFTPTTYTASTISFTDANPDTIDDSANGLGDFVAGQQIAVNGSTSNDNAFTIATVAVGSIVLDSTNSLTVEAAGESISLSAVTHPVATDWGRTIDLANITDNLLMIEDGIRALDFVDPDSDRTGTPTHFTQLGAFFRIYPISSGTLFRERYWKIPDTLATSAATSDLPLECENLIMLGAWIKQLDYIHKFDQADRRRVDYRRELERAKIMNEKMTDRMFRMGTGISGRLDPPKFPSNYGVNFRF